MLYTKYYGGGVTLPARAPLSIAGIIVHHRRWDTVTAVARALVDEGVDALLVVDNSEQPDRLPALRASLPAGVELLATPNDGYAAAVNVGIRHLDSAGPAFLLIATHEVVVHRGAVAALHEALRSDPGAAAAGPTLLSHTPDGQRVVWSRGGTFSRMLRQPAHVSHGLPALPDDATHAEARDWLDGAFVLYRREDLATTPLSERFFLYMEETDLHLRLGRAGRRVLWVPAAIVEQESSGTPPYWFARNLSLLFHRNMPRWRSVTVPLLVGRAVAAAVVRRQPARVRALVSGLAAGIACTVRR